MPITFERRKLGPFTQSMFGLLVAVFVIVAAIPLWGEVEFSLKASATSGGVFEQYSAGPTRRLALRKRSHCSRVGTFPDRVER